VRSSGAAFRPEFQFLVVELRPDRNRFDSFSSVRFDQEVIPAHLLDLPGELVILSTPIIAQPRNPEKRAKQAGRPDNSR
jgi:hypothetical protein